MVEERAEDETALCHCKVRMTNLEVTALSNIDKRLLKR